MEEPHVFFFGDSHTLGVGDPEALGWVGRIAATGSRRGLHITPYNLGIRGQTTSQIAARWDGEMATRLPETGPVAVVFASGVNDTTIRRGSIRSDLDQSLSALEQIIVRAEDRQIKSFVVGPAAVDDSVQNDRIKQLSDRFGALCRERDIGFAPVFDATRGSAAYLNEIQTNDGAHPGVRGYEVMADAILAAGFFGWLEGLSN